MWKEALMHYGVFILEVVTLLLVVAGVFAFVVMLKQKSQHKQGELQITDLKQQYEDNSEKLKNFRVTEEELKFQEKQQKKAEKEKAKAEKQRLKQLAQQVKNGQAQAESAVQEQKNCLYVLNFKGDIHASETASLREEISAILSVAKPEQDEVLLRLESPGGVVHGYGLAASQLKRLKEKGIKLTVAVDKVAASGGYMMACVADRIIAAPFAILGSVGVVAQVPNIHRFLKKNDIDVDVMTAGEYKRTVTLLGENTEKGRKKFQQELEETHALFKQFVNDNRPQVDIDRVATGEHWFGQQALSLNLVDEIATSDDVILQAIKEKDVLEVKYTLKKSLIQKLGQQAEESSHNFLMRWLKKETKTLI